MTEHISLQLFVAGSSPRSVAAVERLGTIVAGLPGASLEVIDVLEQPEVAERRRVVATPTLIRLAPGPQCRIIGDLSDREAVLSYLLPRGVQV